MEDDLLRALREQGQWDSEGSFTLDPQQVWRKLGQFALADERRYLLHLVAWAVGRGASSVEITQQVGRLEVRPRGKLAAPPAPLQNLLTGEMLNGSGWRDLLIATATAARRKGSRVVIEEGATLLRADSSGLSVEFGREAGALWSLEEDVSRLSHWFSRLLGDQAPEVALLREWCAYCEVPILVNGEAIGLPLRLPPVRKGIHLVGPRLPITPEALAAGDIASRPSPGTYSCLVLASSAEILPTRALYIVHGITFERPPVQLYGENFVAVVNAPYLEKDLSGQGLVEDETLREIDEQVARLARELWESP